MSSSYTITEAQTFTVTHARHMAAKVAADLKRMQRLYGEPSDADIQEYEAEVITLLKDGYLGAVWYGFRRNGEWIEPTLQYTASDLANDATADDDPGRIKPRKDIDGAAFYTFLEYSAAWGNLTDAQKELYKGGLPFKRTNASSPSINGYLESDRTYSSGGRSLSRASVRGY
tara:strand:- start:248 stop:763 length:516 start_codon:yes stop_codon:yes gene_type:complete